MMVKLAGATIARATVLASVKNVSVAHIAVQADVFFDELNNLGGPTLFASLLCFNV